MRKDKNDVMDLIRRMPDDVTTADIMDELYFKQQVDQGLRDLAEGRVLTHQEMRERLAKWRKSVGH
jgi:predicted transcriptional regulator